MHGWGPRHRPGFPSASGSGLATSARATPRLGKGLERPPRPGRPVAGGGLGADSLSERAAMAECPAGEFGPTRARTSTPTSPSYVTSFTSRPESGFDDEKAPISTPGRTTFKTRTRRSWASGRRVPRGTRGPTARTSLLRLGGDRFDLPTNRESMDPRPHGGDECLHGNLGARAASVAFRTARTSPPWNAWKGGSCSHSPRSGSRCPT